MSLIAVNDPDLRHLPRRTQRPICLTSDHMESDESSGHANSASRTSV